MKVKDKSSFYLGMRFAADLVHNKLSDCADLNPFFKGTFDDLIKLMESEVDGCLEREVIWGGEILTFEESSNNE